MKKIFVFLAMIAIATLSMAKDMASPNGLLTVQPWEKGCRVYYKQQLVLEVPVLNFGQSATLSAGKAKAVKADYTMLTGKKLHCTNEANEYRMPLGTSVTLVMRLYNDGIAFRYETSLAKKQEQTVYRIPAGTKRWMQKWADSYEGFFPQETSSPDGRWGYPALLEPAEGIFALISEANIERGQSASCLYNEGDRFRVVPDETLESPTSDHTPWRIVIIGQLQDIISSTLVTDVSEPCQLKETAWIQPGVASWIYWAYNHGSNDYQIICKYVDMAAALRLPYVLIDAEWDEMKDGKTIQDAISYAKKKGVKPMIWYNSSMGWVNGAPGPKFRLNKPEDREKEFAWCERLGVAGVKIDFFSGDNQMNMDYCIDLLECAARHHLLVNFHGATIPRGWQRTYPNLMSTEGVYGAEWYNNVPTFTAKAASHNATLPFTRNVIGPMDYTPCAFSDSQHPHITTHAHELALTVLFESGLLHLADRPESYFAQPHEVLQFLSGLPTVWDETRLLHGYPGVSVVLARRSGDIWYLAGINGTDSPTRLPLPHDFISKPHGDVLLFTDRGERQFGVSAREHVPDTVSCLPRGGFVCVVYPKPHESRNNMPLFQTKFTADPSPLVIGDTLFLYTSHDASPEDIPDPNEKNSAGFFMYDWLLWSTTDMVNWTEHGAVASLKDFSWRSRDNGAWAIQTVERNGKYYLYAPLHGHGIGVLVSDSPYGPFKDPLGEPLVWQKEHWNDIDPSVYTDDDGQAYMYWGNPHTYWVKLNDDMISVKGDITQLPHIPNYQEGPWFYKRKAPKEAYYLAFASTCCPEALGYAMSQSPTGPWEWKGYIMRPTQRDRGNHPGICDFKGHSYVFGQNYDLMHQDLFEHHERRSVTAAEITYLSDGTIQEVPYWLDQKPLKQLQWLNPYKRVEAETMNWGYGLKSSKMGIQNTGVVKDMLPSTGRKNMYIYDLNDGEYIRLRGVNFGSKSASLFDITAAATGSATITLRLDNENGPVVGTLTISSTGSAEDYRTFSTKVKGATGIRDLYLCFSKTSGDVRLDWWQFK